MKYIYQLLILFIAQSHLHSAIIYVDASSTGLNNGTNWSNAYNELYTAIENSSANDEIWVAAGWYFPSGASAMEIDHTLHLYGGFAGNETLKSQRNWSVNKTTVSGNINNIFIHDDNAETLFRTAPYTTTTFDGLVIRDTWQNNETFGYDFSIVGDNDYIDQEIELIIVNCTFINCSGGVIRVFPSGSTVNIENCLFHNNVSDGDQNTNLINTPENLEMFNCTFSQNYYVELISPGGEAVIANCISYDNLFDTEDIEINIDDSVYLFNCLFLNFQDVVGGGAYIYMENMLSGNPRFEDAENNDYSLSACSELINAGNLTYSNTSIDLNGNTRLVNDNIDPGCFEFQDDESIIYVDHQATGSASGISWANAFTDINAAIEAAAECAEIWIAEGTYVYSNALNIHKNVNIYGGFSGDEFTRAERNWHDHITKISGDIGIINFINDNLSTLMNIDDLGNEIQVTIDGVTFLRAYAEGTNEQIAPILVDLENNQSTLDFKHCTFKNNQGPTGVMRLEEGEVNVTNSLFHDNIGHGNAACILLNGLGSNEKIVIDHCTFSQNSSDYIGTSELIYLQSAVVVVKNSIFWDNDVDSDIRENTFLENVIEISNSIINAETNTFEIAENIYLFDPLFNDYIANDFSLTPCSPALEKSTSESNYAYDIQKVDRNSKIADLGAFEFSHSSDVIFVDASATGANDGSLWANAFTDLQDAMAVAQSGDEIWIAAGTYLPTETNDPDIAFIPGCGVSLYGGFVGFEYLKQDRNILENPTILSGDIGGNTDAHHIIIINDFKPFVEYDGLTIQQGNATSDNFPIGAGILIGTFDGMIDACTFEDNEANSGGAVYIQEGQFGEIKNCIFNNNEAIGEGGGAITSKAADMTIKKSIFAQNIGQNGGALNLRSGTYELENLLLIENESTDKGGALFSTDTAKIDMKWCTVYNNFSTTGGALYLNDAESSLRTINSIYGLNETVGNAISHFAGSTDSIEVTTCIVQNGWPNGTNVIDSDPLFKDPSIGNFVPSICSPAIDAAQIIAQIPTLDLKSSDRNVGGGPDIGAFENALPYYITGKAGDDKLSCSGDNKTLTFSLPQKDTAYTDLPGGELKSGIMFDVVPTENILLKRLHGHWIENNTSLLTKLYVYWCQGSAYDAGNDINNWTFGNALSGIGINSTLGEVSHVIIDYLDLEMQAGKTYGFYIYIEEEGGVDVEYVRTHTPPTSGFQDLQTELDHMNIYYGRSTDGGPWGSMSPFAAAFEGGLTYVLYDSLQWSDENGVIANTQSVTVAPTETTEYYATMYDLNGCTFTDTVAVIVTDIPENNNCSSATNIDKLGKSYAGTTRCASGTVQSNGSCNTNNSPTVWYTFSGPTSTQVEIEVFDLAPYTTNFNVKFIVFNGTCGSLTEIACVDDWSTEQPERVVLTNLAENEIYYVAVRAANTQQGDFTIRLRDACQTTLEDAIHFPNDSIVCDHNTLTLNTGLDAANINQILWRKNAQSISNAATYIIDQSDGNGLYSYVVLMNDGCISKDTMLVQWQRDEVKNTFDLGYNSLRSVVGCLVSGDTARISPMLNGDTIKLTGPQIDLNTFGISILGNGTANTLVSAEANHRIFGNFAGSTATIQNMSLINGTFNAQSGGGAIRNDGNLILKNILLENNFHAIRGGAIFNQGNLLIDNVFFEGNHSFGSGKQIFNVGEIELSNLVLVRQ